MKRFLLIAMVIGATVVAGGWWYHRRQLLSDRLTAAAQATAVEAALQERIDTAAFAGDEQPWGQVLDVLKSRSDVPLVVDEDETKSMGVDRQTRVDVPEGEFPLRELLDEITGRMDLTWRRVGSHIEITSVSIAEPSRKRLITRVYPLPAGTAAGGKLIDDADALYDLITASIEPNSWDDVGGPGVIEPAGGALVIRQTAEIHHEIAAFFGRMAELPDGPPQHFCVHDLSDANVTAERALSKVVTADFKGERLESVLDQLGQQVGVPIRLGDRSIAWAPIRLQSGTNESLQSFLQQLLAQVRFTYCIRNGGILVTTEDEVQSYPETWFYDVGDLLIVDGGSEFDTLIDLLTTTVEPDSWEEVGGPGTIQELGDNWLVVVQSRDNHQRLQRTLSRIRAHLAPGIDPAGDLPLEPIDDVAPAIHQALETDVTLSFESRQLRDLCAELSQQLSIQVIPRQAFLADGDISLEAPLSCDLPTLPLKHALALLLAEHQLTFDPRGEVLHITTPEDAENNLVTRIIDVRHLVDPAGGGFDEDTIIELLTTCVEPDTWEEVGGPGSTDIFRGLLVFRQTYGVSRQVQELIDAISDHCLPRSHAGKAGSTSALLGPKWLDGSGRIEKLAAALRAEVTLHVEPPIEPSIRRLCGQHGIPCVFDRQWMADADVDVPWPGYVLDVADQPLESILSKLAESKEGGVAIKHGVLRITDQVSAAAEGLPRLYPANGLSVDGETLTADQVAGMLTERLQPDTWRANGGYGIIRPVGDEWLLVVQTLPMHRRVETALAKLGRGENLPLPMP